MARKGIQEKSLFNGHRRKIQFTGGCTVFLDPQGNKHIRVKIKMPITGQPMLNTPEFVSLAYEGMEKDGSAEAYTEFDRYMLGMSCVLTASEAKSSKKLARLIGCELSKLSLQKDGSGSAAIVSLYFTLDVLGDVDFYNHMWLHHNNVNWAEFDFDENSIVFPEDDVDEEEEAAPEGEDTTVAEGTGGRRLVLTKPGKGVN